MVQTLLGLAPPPPLTSFAAPNLNTQKKGATVGVFRSNRTRALVRRVDESVHAGEWPEFCGGEAHLQLICSRR